MRTHEEIVREAMLINGDEPGHPFRGNQHTDGEGGGGNAEMRTKSGDRMYQGDEVKYGKIKGTIVHGHPTGQVKIKDATGKFHIVPHFEDLKLLSK